MLKGTFTQLHEGEVRSGDEKFDFAVKNTSGIAVVIPGFVLDDFIRRVVMPRVQAEATATDEPEKKQGGPGDQGTTREGTT